MSEKSNKNEYYKILEARDKPMPMKQFFFETEQFKDKPPVDVCGNCESVISRLDVFCSYCGQRIDHENYAL